MFNYQKLVFMEGIIVSLVIGAVAGWLASKLFHGASNGLLVNMLLGIIGGVLGGWLLGGTLSNLIPIPYVGDIITAAIGSIILLWGISLLKKK